MKKEAEISKARRFEQILAVLSKYNALSSMTPEKLRMILEDLGPTYVKLGQIMSSRQDLLPAEYTAQLEKLRSSVNPMDYETVAAVIESSLGKKPEELFAWIDHNPLGAASMAQVHAVQLKDGTPAVIKVQRPGIYEQMEVDVAMMKKAGRLLSLNKVISSIVDVQAVIDEFWASAKEEMDFEHEARNAIRFKKQNEGNAAIFVPAIFNEFTRKDVLVMEDVRGIEIDDYPALSDAGYSRSEIAMKLGMNYIDQVVNYGFFHADPHSGNLKIQDDQIAWMDFGMMGEISPAEAAQLKKALQALALHDHSGLADAVLAIGIAPDDLDYPGFCNALENYMNRYVSMSFDQMDLAKMVAEAIDVCRDYHIRLPKGITMLARSMVTMQGTLKDLDAQTNVLSYVSQESFSLDNVDWNKEITEILRQLAAAAKASLSVPLSVQNVLRQMQKGQLTLNLRLADLPSLMPDLNKITDRLIVCILIAALLVGSSIVCTTNLKPTLLGIPLIGLAGFLLSFILSLWLFYKMIFHPSKNNRLF